MSHGNLQLVSGNATPKLADRIAEFLGISVTPSRVGRFPDGEIDVQVNENVRGNDVFIVQSSSPPVNDNLMELLILIDAVRRASAARVTAVIQYFGYARKDRKDEGRVPITAKLVANLLVEAGADRVLTIDLHAPQIQGFFDIPVDHLYAGPVIRRHFLRQDIQNLVVVAPDAGSAKMARGYANRLGGDIAIVDKRRVSGEEVEIGAIIGEVEGRNVLIADDMISTAGSITEAAKLVRAQGAASVRISATHGVLCGPARERLKAAPLDEIVLTDTIHIDPQGFSNLTVVSVAPLLGEAIIRVHEERSLSVLFGAKERVAEL